MYLVSRLYSGSSDRTAGEICDIVQREVLPQLVAAGGLSRYGFYEVDGGGLASTSLHDTQQSARKAQQIAKAWVSSTSVLRNYKLDATNEGEVGFTIQGRGNHLNPGVQGLARIHKTNASIEQVKKAVTAHEAEIARCTGFMRMMGVVMTDGRIGMFSAFESPEGVNEFLKMAEGMRNESGSDISKVFTSAPEMYQGKLLMMHNS
jgi:hypothetical protein